MNKVHNRRAFLGASAFALYSARASAQHPQRVVNFVVPWPAGNPTDAIARQLVPLMGKELTQTLIVDNVIGAGGTLGVQKVLNAPADGQMILMATTTDLIMSPLGLASAKYRPEDLRLAGYIGRTPYALLGRPDLPVKNLPELMALMRKSGAKEMSYGSIGQGSLIHLAGARFGQVSGLKLLHVPYKGLPQMMQDLLGSQIDLAFLPLAGNVPSMIEQGKLKFYGVTAASPNPLLPKLATMASLDKSFQGFEFDVWAALALPRNVPDATVTRIHQAFYAALRNPDLRLWLESTGSAIAAPMTLLELDRLYTEQIKIYQALAKSIDVQPQ